MKYDIFIEGETVDLCIPVDDEDVVRQWSSWFNKSEITRYLSQGMYPNTVNNQKEYFDEIRNSSKKILCLLKPKKYDGYIGVVSLSEINHIQRQCTMALVVGEKYKGPDSIFIGLEAKALITKHAIEVVGVERINSLQVVNLKKWQNMQILFGYQVEGLLRNKFRKGNKTYDMLISSCLLEDYEKLLTARNGEFWPGKSKVFDLMRKLPEDTLIDRLMEWIANEQKKYWKLVFEK
jgi:RimJ/RimL family protein N-acetyltransferase